MNRPRLELPAQAFLDDLFVGDEGLLFRDGFESGDLDAWSGSVP